MAAQKKERTPSHSWTMDEDKELIRLLNAGVSLDDAEGSFPGVSRTSIASHARTLSTKLAERGVELPKFRRSAGKRGEQLDALAEFARETAAVSVGDAEEGIEAE